MAECPRRYLVLVADVDEILAIVTELDDNVRLAADVDEAMSHVNGSQGWAVLAFTPRTYQRALERGRLPNYPLMLIHTTPDEIRPEWVGSSQLPIYEIPAELDWIREHLGQYKPAPESGTCP